MKNDISSLRVSLTLVVLMSMLIGVLCREIASANEWSDSLLFPLFLMLIAVMIARINLRSVMRIARRLL